MAAYFEHYPSPPDEIIGIAADLVRHARNAHATTADVSRGVERATDAVDGDLTFPMEQSAHPVVNLGTNVARGAWFASGVLMLFAQAIERYNVGIDRLNAQIGDGELDAMSGPGAEKLHALQVQQARLEEALDDEATRVAGMLERGPNDNDINYLRDHGFLPIMNAKDPHLLAALAGMRNAKSPEEMRRWWESLSLAQQLGLMTFYPRQLGNKNGLPAEVRDEANRIVLAEDYAGLKAMDPDDLSPVQRKALANMEKIMGQLAEREAHKDPITGEPIPVQLYIYRPYEFDGDGRVAIAVGNLDEAEHVGVNVRGATNVQGLTATRTVNMYDQSRWASGDSVAVLDWMGYDAPNTGAPEHPAWDRPMTGLDQPDALGVTNTWMADAGAEQLAADVAGLRASRGYDPAHLTVVGHSYGSTTAAKAAQAYGLDADDLVLIGSPGTGSPGVPGDDAGDLTTGHDHTWAATASHDLEADAAGLLPLGDDPVTDDFGANRFRAEHVDREDGADNHTDSYYSRNSEGLSNIADIVTGQYGGVRAAEPRYYDPVGGEVEDPEHEREPHRDGRLPRQPLPTPEGPPPDRRHVP